MRISVIGLGKLGMCLAAVMAYRSFQVTGVDVDPAKVAALNGGPCPLYERGLEEMLWTNAARLRGTGDISAAVAESDATFVVVPTPSERSGGYSLAHVLPVMRDVGAGIRGKKSRHLVVLTSTVMPASMDEFVVPELETASGMKCGKGFGACYNPEFIALGDVISGMLNPDLVLIGESDRRSGDQLSEIQRLLCANSPAFARMGFINAELAKISLNSFVTMKMSFANTLAEICEGLPGGDVDKVSSAIGQDKRIGPLYLKGGMGYGGPCFPRDNMAFSKIADSVGAQSHLAVATNEINRRQVQRLLDLAERAGLTPGMAVGILGLAYKPGTNILDESQSVMLCESLGLRGYRIYAYDPAAGENAKQALGEFVHIQGSSREVIQNSDICFIATPWEEFRKLEPALFAGKALVDCWRALPAAKRAAKRYVAIGLGPEDPNEGEPPGVEGHGGRSVA